MASINQQIIVDVPPATIWDAVRDVGEVHTRLAPGFVVDTKLDEDGRLVTFGNGATAYELIVDCNDDTRRLAWSVSDSPLIRHYHASLQVLPTADDDASSRVVWIADLLPDDAAPRISEMIGQGLATMKRTLEGA